MSALDDLRVEALFASHLQPSDQPSWKSVRDIVHAVGFQVGEARCVAVVAQEFGDHPEQAAERMSWCRQAVADAFFDVLL